MSNIISLLAQTRSLLGVTRRDRIRDECIRETAKVEWFGEKLEVRFEMV